MTDASSSALHGAWGRVLKVDLTTGLATTIQVPASVYRAVLGGYGLGAWLMWHHFPAGADALAPEACFAICAGMLTGLHAPFSGRIQIVGKSPLTQTWGDSNSGGSVASHLRSAGYDALLVTGQAAQPSVLVVNRNGARVEPAGALWGQQVPEAFDALVARYGDKRHVGISAIGPAGERGAKIASVMNDRYHAFGRQGFGAVYGAKQLKAIVVEGDTLRVPVHDAGAFAHLCADITKSYKRDLSWWARLFVYLGKPHRWLKWFYRLGRRVGAKVTAPTASMRQLWAQRGTTGAVALSIENGDAPIKNWRGVGTTDFPFSSKGLALDGAAVDKLVTKKLSCGDCPMPCKGIVAVPDRKLRDVRRPDYETLIGFGANLLQADLALVTACHDACNRYGIDAVSASATLGWACEAVEKGLLTTADLDGISLQWGDGEAALALTERMGTRSGCGAWLSNGVRDAAAHLGKGSAAFAVHVHGSEPAYHDSRFTSLMGVTYIADPTPGRHTAGSASWNETFAADFPLPAGAPKRSWNVGWKSRTGKGPAQALFSNAHQTMNGLGICMFTLLTGSLPWAALVNAVTGWNLDDAELLRCGERIQNLRNAFNRREGIRPADFAPHPRMMGEGDGHLTRGPLRGVRVPLPVLRDEYFVAMHWDPQTGAVSDAQATALGLDALLAPIASPSK